MTEQKVNTTRRQLLTIAAGGAVAAVIPADARARPGHAADPIYAAIERHKAAGAVWNAAVAVEPDFPEGPEPLTDEQWEQRDELDDAIDDARESLVDAGVDLVNTAPTTAAGIVTAIGYMQMQMRDYGTFMPFEIKFEFEFAPGCGGDGAEVMGWIDAWLSTIANAATALGKAAQS